MFTGMPKFEFDEERREVSEWMDGPGRTAMMVAIGLLAFGFIVFLVAGMF